MQYNNLPGFRSRIPVRLTVLAIRLLLGMIFLLAGLSNLIDFPVIIGPVLLEEKAAAYGMEIFARFVAIEKSIVGAMLLTRFATLGAIILFPMILGILIFTISLGWQETPYINSVLLSFI